ncbi:MAG: glycosyltransferase [Candidatus Omnitrophota bacterium]
MPEDIHLYEPIVGASFIEELELLAGYLKGKKIKNINSTAQGGGVAEILNRMVPLLQSLDVDVSWSVIQGSEDFFQVTKKIHNALHGQPVKLSRKEIDLFLEYNEKGAQELSLDADITFVHDPQPIALIGKKTRADGKWIWRCHVDVSAPDKKVWKFLKKFIEKYDSAVFSAPAFAQHLNTEQILISPSIDPLSDKNKELPEETILSVLKKYGLPYTKPLITQVSRFDRLKDPVGVIEVFKLVRKYVDCHLVLAGSHAADDPESAEVLAEVREKSKGDSQIHILLVDPETNDIDVNAIQRGSTVILQKSIREGFALTVTEALWKAKPVVASAVGGIPLQIKHKYHGMLSYTIEGTAFFVRELLNNPEYAAHLGKNGKEHIKNNFLLTRHIKDYLLLFLSLYRKEDVVLL